MKKLLFGVLIVFSIPMSSIAATTTSRIGLTIPAYADQNWDVQLRSDFNLIDSTLACLGQSNVFSALNTFSSQITASGGVKFGDNSVQTTAFTPASVSVTALTASTGTFSSGLLAGSGNGNVLAPWKYRRPDLVYLNDSTTTVQTGLVDGVSGDATVLFPDGQLRTETSAALYQASLGQTAIFNNATQASNRGGLRTGTVALDSWYAHYAVKCASNTTDWIMVADTIPAVVANFAALNSYYGANGWVFLGVVRYGDKSGSRNKIVQFQQSGNQFVFLNKTTTDNVFHGPGILYQTGLSSATLTWTSSLGMGSNDIPPNVTIGFWRASSADTQSIALRTGSASSVIGVNLCSAVGASISGFAPSSANVLATNGGGSAATDLFLLGFSDDALGVGSNPLF